VALTPFAFPLPVPLPVPVPERGARARPQANPTATLPQHPHPGHRLGGACLTSGLTRARPAGIPGTGRGTEATVPMGWL